MKEINMVAVKKASSILRAIDHNVRRNLIKTIDHNRQIRTSVLIELFQLDQTIASQQLAILRRENVVVATRDGREISYSINYQQIYAISRFVNSLASTANTKS